MITWFKIFGNQFLGFWTGGILMLLLQELPYIVMSFIHLKENPIMNMTESSVFLNICEKALGSLCIAVMLLIVQKNVKLFGFQNSIEKIGFIAAISALFLNYFGWGLYFSGHQSVKIILTFIVLMPPLYYTFIGLWRQNWILFCIGILFTIVHFTHVYGNLKIM